MTPRVVKAVLAALLLLAVAPGCAEPLDTADRAADATAPCGTAVAVAPERAQVLMGLADELGLDHPQAFAGVAATLEKTGALPRCYLTKDQAREAGWRPGGDLWEHRPGYAIGGDRFGNFERRLPQHHAYVAADLDYAGGRRGPRRLVYVTDAEESPAVWVTVDHYNTFTAVPPAP
ncbi:MAG: ribonuclease [Rhodospirillales bacterium]|nr:MAG: ribonuclease [Rhodospirillales bacterium]